MIRYAMACDEGHQFESWFPSSQAFDDQVARGLVACPVCDSKRVAKTLMAPALARNAEPLRATTASAPDATDPVDGPIDQHMRAMLRAMHGHIRRTADDVGPRFATEARAMHYGEVPHRAIYGAASANEARTLVDEGIDICPLPPMPDDQN